MINIYEQQLYTFNIIQRELNLVNLGFVSNIIATEDQQLEKKTDFLDNKLSL